MKILVINGSPKGSLSISFQYVKYLEKLTNGKNEFDVIHVGQEINKLEIDKQYFDSVCDRIIGVNVVLWVYGVYTLLVPYQLVRFIELLYERDKTSFFNGKFSSQLATSKHFYDITAANYIQQISEDFNMKLIIPHLADSNDMLTEKGQKALSDFLTELEFSTINNIYLSSKYQKTHSDISSFNVENFSEIEKDKKHNISIITYFTDENSNLKKMINTFVKITPSLVNVVNLADVNIKSGCLGCIHCALEGECVIKDDFKDLFSEYIGNAQGIIYAFEIQHHWFNSQYKKFDDRSFANGHRISNMGKPVGYLISGDLKNEPNIREILEARAEVGGMYLCDIVSDENPEIVVKNIKMLSKKMIWSLENKATRPINFRGVGGMKIFRDLIYVMRGFMVEDHKFYKEHELYDFPQKQKKAILQGKIIGCLLKFKKIRKKVMPMLKTMMIEKHKKVIENLNEKKI